MAYSTWRMTSRFLTTYIYKDPSSIEVTFRGSGCQDTDMYSGGPIQLLLLTSKVPEPWASKVKEPDHRRW